MAHIGFGRKPERCAQVAGDGQGENPTDNEPMKTVQPRLMVFGPRQQHPRIFGGQYRRSWRQRHQIHGAFAGSQGQQGELRHQPHTEKQPVAVAQQAFAEVPQAQVHQDIPRQKGFRQFREVIVKRLVMPGFDKRTAEAPDAIGP